MDDRFEGRKVLVFGLGLNQGGVGSAKFFAREGAKVKVTDLKTPKILGSSLNQLKKFPGITYTLGKHKYEDITWADLIIKNPAVKPGNQYMEYARKLGKKIETDMGIFLQYVRPDQIIGITGTKGKSTTASLIYEILSKSRDNVILAGNIGKSVLDVIPSITRESLIVLEISSFQLEAFETHKVSPKWAVITNITPDHLNYHQSMREYIESKKMIGKYQNKTGFLFLRKDDPITAKPDFQKRLKAQIIYFSKNDLPKNFHPELLGSHNLENMAAALTLAKTFRLDEKSTLEVLSKFKGVPFRMELIKTWNGVKIYNDTTATSPEASIQAIKTLGVKRVLPPGDLILICGGMNKKMDYTEYATAAGKNARKIFFLEGDSTEEIKKKLLATDYSLPTAKSQQLKANIMGTYNNLERLLTDVKKVAASGDIILFSPAATSFNLFQNEFDRGRKFNEAVRKIFKSA